MSDVYSAPEERSPEQDQVGRIPATHTDLSAGRAKTYAPNPYWSQSGSKPTASSVSLSPAPESAKTDPDPAADTSSLPSPTADGPTTIDSAATVAIVVPVSRPTETTQPEPVPELDTDTERRLRLAWQETLEPIQTQLAQLTQELAKPQSPIVLPDELTKQVSQHITDWLPTLPDLLRPTLEQLLAKAVPRVIRVEQPGRAVLRLVRVLTALSVVLGLLLGGLVYEVFDLRRQLSQVTPGYWQHRYLQARAGASRNHPLRQWLYQADTLYAGTAFAPTLLRLEDQTKTKSATRTKARSGRHN